MPESGDRGRVKVVDRRRFTPEGALREPSPADTLVATEPVAAVSPAPEPEAASPAPPAPTQVSASAAVAEQPAEAAAAQPADGPGTLPPGPGLADIVDLLAQQAMAFLSGQVPGRGRDPRTARYFIDLLGVLKDKTTGRLTLEETNFIDDVLYQLRSLYVAATR